MIVDLPSTDTSAVNRTMVDLRESAGAVALGRSDRHPVITTVGVLSLLGAVCTILFDLGLSLMAAAGVFGVAAIVALAAGWTLRTRGRP